MPGQEEPQADCQSEDRDAERDHIQRAGILSKQTEKQADAATEQTKGSDAQSSNKDQDAKQLSRL
jgi:hypothetical protein